MFSCGVYEIFKNLRTTTSETCCFTCSVLLNKYTLSQIDTWFLYHNLQFRLPVTNTTDSAIIRSSRLVVFYKKGVLTNFAKFTRKIPRQCLAFKEAADLQSLTLSKKEIPAHVFL